MKVLFIEARKKAEEPARIENLPKEIHILYTIQYKNLAEKIRKNLEKKHKVVAFEQVLGCSKIKPKAPLLLIGSGRFHALQIALSAGKELMIYEEGRINRITEEEINVYINKQRAKIKQFLSSDKIGLLVSVKPGQNKLEEAINLKKKLEKKYQDKNFYILIADTINNNELENFSINPWINFACPGIELDTNKIINYKTLLQI